MRRSIFQRLQTAACYRGVVAWYEEYTEANEGMSVELQSVLFLSVFLDQSVWKLADPAC